MFIVLAAAREIKHAWDLWDSSVIVDIDDFVTLLMFNKGEPDLTGSE